MTTFTFTPVVTGAPNLAADVNTPLTALASVVNGNLDTNNLSASAGIVGTQLSAGAAIAGTQLSASAAIAGTQLASAAAIKASQLDNGSTVTSLPGTPYNGQEINFLADATAGVVWRLKYRSASAHASKWEFIGGPKLRLQSAAVLTAAINTEPTYTSLSTVTRIQAPLAGQYQVDYGAQGLAPTGGGTAQDCYLIAKGAEAHAVSEACAVTWSEGNSRTHYPAPRSRLVTAAAALNYIELVGRSGAAPSAWNVSYPWLTLQPVRVGP